MDLANIQQSILKMSDAELVEFIEEMRKKRGRSVTTAKDKTPKKLSKLLAGMGGDEIAALLQEVDNEGS